jgi:hypothetical protein
VKTRLALQKMISAQEELDWQCYRLYGLLDDELCAPNGAAPPIDLGERAFEILMARRMAAGDLETTWFERHGSAPTEEIPAHWPEDYRTLVARRIHAIETIRNVALVEQPEYKRRWNTEPWASQQLRALREWLLDRLESAKYWTDLELVSCSKLADRLREDVEFLRVAELYRGRPDFDVPTLVLELVEPCMVPLLASLRYRESGIRKRQQWESTWSLQRREDQIVRDVLESTEIPEGLKAEMVKTRITTEIGDISVPPKFESQDFVNPNYWMVRGRLDAPKERFVALPFCERDVDPTPVIAWGGWTQLQLAQAIAAYYERVKNHEGWKPERRAPLLLGILELLPWLKQWHNEIHPEYHERMGDFFQQFVEDEARMMEMTLDDIRAWTPPVQSRTRGRKKRNT